MTPAFSFHQATMLAVVGLSLPISERMALQSLSRSVSGSCSVSMAGAGLALPRSTSMASGMVCFSASHS